MKTIQYIDRMEAGAGYDKRTKIVYDGNNALPVTVFIYQNQPQSEAIEHGDWILHLTLNAKPEDKKEGETQ